MMTQVRHYFDHEKLDVYRLSIEFVGWAEELLLSLESRHHNTRDQLDRSSQSVPLNIAEGNGKRLGQERRRFFEIARASATESAAALDVLVAKRAATPDRVDDGKQMLVRIVAMLTRLAPPRSARRGVSSTSTRYENEYDKKAEPAYGP